MLEKIIYRLILTNFLVFNLFASEQICDSKDYRIEKSVSSMSGSFIKEEENNIDIQAYSPDVEIQKNIPQKILQKINQIYSEANDFYINHDKYFILKPSNISTEQKQTYIKDLNTFYNKLNNFNYIIYILSKQYKIESINCSIQSIFLNLLKTDKLIQYLSRWKNIIHNWKNS